MDIRHAPVREIDPVALYRILALRVDVFVVEQACAYRELDGRDLEPDAQLIWAEIDAAPVATLRLLVDADGSARIGRVATAQAARSGGIARALVECALELVGPGRDAVLDAQIQLEGWYGRLGFARAGADFDEDGITHVPMRRPANAIDTSD